jgi:hypothetical protein
MKTQDFLRNVMKLAWQFVRRNGFAMSEALKIAWLNLKLKVKMYTGIVKFYFQKVDGSTREAYGTLNKVPPTSEDNRRKNDTVQVYFDTERQEWRSFKMANLISI